MTRLLQLASASAVALAMGACATTDDYRVVETTTPVTTTTTVAKTETLSDAQQIGVADKDGYMAAGATDEKLDDKFKVDCNDDDGFVATGCETEMVTQTTTTMVTDTALVPQKTVLELIAESPDHEMLEKVIAAASLEDEIMALPDGFTIFAPTDAAFDGADLGAFAERGDIPTLLMNHIIPSRVMSVDLVGLVPATGYYNADTLGDRTLDFMMVGDDVRLVGYNQVLIPISTVDLVGTDGVIHVIDSVLVPPFVEDVDMDEYS